MLSVFEPTLNPNSISLKVLIVEDGYQTIKLLAEGLYSEIRYPFIIQQVRQSCQALDRLSHEAFDLLIVHLSAADPHVFNAVTQIKQLGLTLPILGLSANEDETLTLEVIQAGTPDDQVTENLKSYRLIRALRQALDEQQRQESQRLNPEQVLTHSALRISEERLQMALSGSDLGLWDWQLITGNVYFNPQWKAMLGYEQNELEDSCKTFEKLVHPDDFSRVKAALKAYLDRLIPIYEVEFRMQCKTGEWKWILSRGKVFEWDEAGNPVRMTGTHRDISDRRQAEDALRESEARERKKAYQLELALCELKNTQAQLVQTKKMASLGQLMAGIAHEINNPIGFISGNVSFAHQYANDLLKLIDLYQQYYPHPVTPVQDEMDAVDLDFLRTDFPKALNSIREGVARIQQIMRSLQHFSHLNEAQIKATDLHQGLESTLIILQNRLNKKPNRAAIEVHKVFSRLPKVECYPSQLNQVFINILNNAIDALEDKIKQPCLFTPQIEITTETNELNSTVTIRFSDNGLGIPVQLQEHLFEPFFTTKPVGQGTGLGLAISYQIIEKHRGKITFNSQVGIGTEFAVEIPITLRKKTEQWGHVKWLSPAIGA